MKRHVSSPLAVPLSAVLLPVALLFVLVSSVSAQTVDNVARPETTTTTTTTEVIESPPPPMIEVNPRKSPTRKTTSKAAIKAEVGTALQRADKAWNEKSYRRALELYRRALKYGQVRDRDEVDYRIAVALGRTQQWDAAIAASNALLNRTQRKARVLYWMGRLYTVLPHGAYRVGKHYYRGSNYPKVKTAEKPAYVELYQNDAERTLDYFERAKITAQQARMQSTAIAGKARQMLPFAEEIDLNFDLAAWVARMEVDDLIAALNGKPKRRVSVEFNPQPASLYSRNWNLAQKALHLYNEISKLDQSRDKHDTALSLLAKGMFIQSYRNSMDGWANRYDSKTKKQYFRRYPYDWLDPLPVWRSVVTRFPRDPIAPQTQLRIAQLFMWGRPRHTRNQVQALAEYRALLQKFPKSKLTNDARAAIQQITRHELSFITYGSQAPGRSAKITFNARNVKSVTFTAYRAKLENTLLQPKKLNDPKTHFPQFDNNFGSIRNVQKYLGPRLAGWSTPTGDKGNHEGTRKSLAVPLKNTGAYIIVAQAPGIRFAQLLMISDLAILKKIDRDETLVYVADARTGRPVKGANVVLKEIYYDGNVNKNKTSIARGVSDANGYFTKRLIHKSGIYSHYVEAFGWSGARYAMTGANYINYYGYYYGNYGDNRNEIKAYAYTDRPVYRPEQKVYFRQILTQRIKGGEQQPLKGARIQVSIRNPKGEEFFHKTYLSSEFGTINGELTLPKDAPLGEYYVRAYSYHTNRNVTLSGGNRFRVEEYKRPEFLVKVDAPKEPAKPGETVAAKIAVQYYFGGPVPNAKVKYTIRRSRWWPSYQFPRPYQWLYTYWNEGDYSTGRRNIGGEGSGKIVQEGTSTTDERGNAEVNFKAILDPEEERQYAQYVNYWGSEYSGPLYTVEAEVSDASRRTIEAQGQVKVSDQQYFAFLDTKQGYYLTGDRVPVELVTNDANDQPFGARGKMVVYKVLPDDKQGKPKEVKVYEEAIDTHEQNPAFWTWTAKGAGYFRVAYEATDAWSKKIRASTFLWVQGPEMNSTQFKLQGVAIVLDKRQYEEGQTLRALLVADKPDTTVLLTQEAGGEILKRENVHIAGKSRIIEIPITRRHVPNFAIAVAGVKDYQIYQAQAEVFVPPAKQLINVEVEPDKDEYKPGETGTMRIKATDWQGKPARAEVSVALTDASLFYIQKSYVPDIRTFYYGERRAISVNLDSFRSGQPEGRSEDDKKYTDYEQHGVSLPDELGQLNLPPGGMYGYTQTYASYGDGANYAFADGHVRWAGEPAAVMAPYAMAMPMRARENARRSSVSSNLKQIGTFNGAANAMSDSVAMPPPNSPAGGPPGAGFGGSSGGLAPAVTRENFAETAFWSPAVVTEGGAATVKVTFPDSLTQWHAHASGLTTNTQVGSGENDVTTKKNLMVRLQAPRFFVERDQVVVSAIVNNYLKTPQKVRVTLDVSKPLIMTVKANSERDQTAVDVTSTSTGLAEWVEIKAGEEKRLDWTVDAIGDGKTTVWVKAQTSEESDAMKMSFPVLVHGVSRFDGTNGVLRQGENRETFKLNLPAERRRGASSLNVQLNPSLAATMLDALPYLADYPYGCVEQTMSRFLPSAIVAKTLRDSGVDLATLRKRAKAYEAEAKAKPIADRIKNSGYTYPTGMPDSRNLEEMSSRLWYWARSNNPIYDEAETNKMVRAGLERLYQMQKPDGGWGWWPESEHSDEYMSAYVVYGLYTARTAGVSVRNDVLEHGFSYVQRQIADEDNLHLITWLAFVHSQRGWATNPVRTIVAGRVYNQRARLTPYSKALLALTLWNIGEKQKAGVLVRNLEDTALIDNANNTATWKMGNEWWRWWNNDVETNAWVLRAFLKIEPRNRLTPMAMKWLTVQGRGNHWRSTKETAIVVIALADYVRVNKELDVDYTLKVRLGNKIERTFRVTSENALYFDNRFIVGDFLLQDGANELTIEKSGRGNVYWNASLEYFSLEEPIRASGNEIGIKRRYFKLTRNPINPKSKTPEYSRTEIKDNAMLKSGDLVEVELTVDSNNDYEYLVFEDMKAAGMEPVDLRSGFAWGDGLCSNVELRDEKVALFVDRLPQGTRVLRYRMRAEIPGQFHALPTNGYAMYAPEVRAISDEMRIGTRD